MFERLQKPYLTVETGEAYQPIRLTYDIFQSEQLVQALDEIKCLEKKQTHSWHWYWRDECDDLHFESLETYQRNLDNPLRLGTLNVRDNQLIINLPSFKRACLAAPFFHKMISPAIAAVHNADFLNKVFGLDERLPHGFTELFKEQELEKIVRQRIEDYEVVQKRCEEAATAEEAFKIISEYNKTETLKRLPYAERYSFVEGKEENVDPDVIYLGFYIFLRSRELVAIRRWFGESGTTLASVAEDIITDVFGEMNVD